MSWFFIATWSALFSASAALLQKKTLFRMNALEFSLTLSLAVALFSAFVPFTADITAFSTQTFLVMMGKSVLSGCAFLLVMQSLHQNEISTALPLLGLTPAVTALISLSVLQEAMTTFEWIGVGLMIAGTSLLERRPEKTYRQLWMDFALAKNYHSIFGAIALFSLSAVADKYLVGPSKVDPLVVLFYQHIVYALFFLSLFVMRRHSFSTLREKGRDAMPYIVVIGALTIAYRLTQLEAMKLAPAALVLAVKRTSILYASFFGGKLFSEERLKWKLAGAALIVAAGFLILRNGG